MHFTSGIVMCIMSLAIYAADIGDNCSIGQKRQIGKGSYFEQCVSKYETAGCFASWEDNKEKKFVEDGGEIDRMYRSDTVGFRYKCAITNGYISFAPKGCVIKTSRGVSLLGLNNTGKMDNGQEVYCKETANGEFSFEFGNSPTEK